MAVREPGVREKGVLDAEACWEVLQRVVGSPQLRRAARMREFLQFVGQRTLKDGVEQVQEQEIGSEVFGRMVGYDTSVDNIVRVNATDLRKRIEDYFTNDGADEPLVFEIPRGSYMPVFRYRHPQVEEAVAAAPVVGAATEVTVVPASPAIATSGWMRWAWGATAVVVAALAIGCAVLWVENQELQKPHYASRDTPALASFWGAFLGTKINTDVILADTSFSLVEDITQQPIALDAYLDHSYMSQIQSTALSADRRADLQIIANRTSGSLGDFRVAQRVIALDPTAKNLHVYYARDYTPPLLKQDNLILIGGPKSNPWQGLLKDQQNFTIGVNLEKNFSYVINRAPAKGEQATYVVPSNSTATVGYSVITFLPNPDHTGKALSIAGVDGQATDAAGEWLTSEEALANLKKLLKVDTLPYFEVVLRTTHLNSTPMSAEVVAYRVYQR
ncbi:hypothetical protein [Granulicella paludicola]|uniref:hypothetical protein n=1 Tax=Granulicella paludicola TaxID=474951 RepID=UPI0021E0178D|nr:hypothetical protein [Granulicella paludicola]